VPLGGRPRIIGPGYEFTMVAYSTNLGANHQPKCRKKKTLRILDSKKGNPQ
jgi:hypothetical protein